MGGREEPMQGPGKLWSREFGAVAANGSDAMRTVF